MSRRSWFICRAVMVMLTGIAAVLVVRLTSRSDPALWHRQVSPGPLSASHASFAANCAACHTPVRGADDVKCIGCHAGATALLERQPTAFHADIEACTSCHQEHRGSTIRPSAMDHQALAAIGLAVVGRDEQNLSSGRVLAWMRAHESAADPRHPLVSPPEAALNCASCHGTRDRHQQLFGTDCATCHATASWTIPGFQHPSPRSIECVQCHRAPPSHFMEHFRMVSQAATRQPAARVDQCFLCHQTTSWNDIRQLGWYKHH